MGRPYLVFVLLWQIVESGSAFSVFFSTVLFPVQLINVQVYINMLMAVSIVVITFVCISFSRILFCRWVCKDNVFVVRDNGLLLFYISLDIILQFLNLFCPINGNLWLCNLFIVKIFVVYYQMVRYYILVLIQGFCNYFLFHIRVARKLQK